MITVSRGFFFWIVVETRWEFPRADISLGSPGKNIRVDHKVTLSGDTPGARLRGDREMWKTMWRQ